MIGLDALDEKILSLIGKKPAHTSLIARQLHQLRTTIQYRLGRLERAGKAEKNTVGKKTVWRPIYKGEHNKNHFRVYEGREMLLAYKQLLTLPHHSTILCIQGTGAAAQEFKNLPALFIQEAHRVFKRKKFVMNAISNERALNIFDAVHPTMVHSHVGRTLGLRLFSGNWFMGDGEIMSTGHFLLLADHKARRAIVIKELNIVEIVHQVLSALLECLDGGKNFDLNRHLANRTSNK